MCLWFHSADRKVKEIDDSIGILSVFSPQKDGRVVGFSRWGLLSTRVFMKENNICQDLPSVTYILLACKVLNLLNIFNVYKVKHTLQMTHCCLFLLGDYFAASKLEPNEKLANQNAVDFISFTFYDFSFFFYFWVCVWWVVSIRIWIILEGLHLVNGLDCTTAPFHENLLEQIQELHNVFQPNRYSVKRL